MVNLFFEIRRGVPLNLQADMKISNSDIGNVMIEVHKQCEDENIRLLIEIFLERAGDNWFEMLGRGSSLTKKPQRSEISVEARPQVKNQVVPQEAALSKPRLIYRGQVVEY